MIRPQMAQVLSFVASLGMLLAPAGTVLASELDTALGADAPAVELVPLTAPPGRSGALAPTDAGAAVPATRAAAPQVPAPSPAVSSIAAPAVAPSPSEAPASSPAASAAADPVAELAKPSPPPVPTAIDVHDAPRDPGKVHVEVDRGKAGGPRDEVDLDLPSLEAEKERIKEVLPEDGAEVAEAEPEFDIPIVVNHKVERWMDYFQTAGRKYMALWLARSQRYIPMMQAILKEKGLPSDLVYLALIESGFSTSARSRASAVGPWQFIQGTGRRYGLRIEWWIDERRDPEKSTIAAANYLSDLHDAFGSWYLAAAGYNAGEGRIVRAVRRFDRLGIEIEEVDADEAFSARDAVFWHIAERRYLAAETRDYVPKLIAAAIIAKNPEQYGFADIEYHEPLAYDKVTVPDATDLQVIAWAAESAYDEIKALNPELRRWATPPNYRGYQVKIPAGKAEVFERNFGGLHPSRRITYRRHVVRSGDTLSRVAARYGVDMDQVRRLNNLRGSMIRAGQSLVVPVPANRAVIAAGDDTERLRPGSRTVAASKRTSSKIRPARAGQGDDVTVVRYRVRPGDTIWGIAQEHNVSVSDIRRWNGFSSRHILKAGERIVIGVKRGS